MSNDYLSDLTYEQKIKYHSCEHCDMSAFYHVVMRDDSRKELCRFHMRSAFDGGKALKYRSTTKEDLRQRHMTKLCRG